MLLRLLLLFAVAQCAPLPLSSPPERRLPSAIIIGVKKAGTRALLEFLRLNPRVKAPGPEVHFFDKHYDNGVDWYRDQMPETREDEMTIEKTPAYFHHKLAPERIKAVKPDMKLIIVVRDPVTRAISDYTQASSKRKRRGLMPSFEQMAVGDCDTWIRANCTGKVKGVNAGWGAIRIGVYHKHARRWLEHFPRHQIHFVDGERLVASPAQEVAAVEKFLGLPSVVHDTDFGVDPVKGFPCVRRSDNTLHCLGKTKGRHHPDVAPAVLNTLERFYRDENEKFFDLVGRRFVW